MGFQLGEGHFDFVEIGAVGRQEGQPSSLGSDHLLSLLAFVSGKIVEDDDIALLERGNELRFDVSVEDAPVLRSIDDEI